MRTLVIAAFATSLAACSQSSPEATETPAAFATPARTAAPAPAPVPASALEIPAQFQGIWDYADGSCNPASDLRTEIAERGITFYESHGAVTALTVESPTRISVELAMEGEGEKWTSKSTFALNENGTLLTPTRDGDTGEPMPLKRCA